MSSKNLLSENTIRRFMKLASIQPGLTSNFVKPPAEPEIEVDYNLFFEAMEDEPDELAPDDAAGASLEGEEAEADIGAPEEEPMEDEGLDLEGGEDLDIEGEEGDVTMTDEEVEAFISFGEKLAAARDQAGELGEEEEAIEGEEPMEDEGLGLEGDEAVPDEGAIPEEPEEEALQERMVNEILKRVTKRILREKIG